MDGNMGSAAEAAGFKAPEAQTALAVRSASAIASRERAQLEAAVAMAQLNPRNELAAVNKIVEACQRPDFAEDATWEFPRGGQNISGPSIYLARGMAGLWGHIRCGKEVVDETQDDVHIRCTAHDVQTGAYWFDEARVKKSIQRKNKATGKTEWVKPDERDLRELVNRHAAMLTRNCILAVIPSDVTDRALKQCAATIEMQAEGKLQKNRSGTIQDISMAFHGLGVTVQMLVDYLGHDLATITQTELVRLRGIYTSVKENNSRVEDHFEVVKPDRTDKPEQPPTAKIDLTKTREGVAIDPPGGQAFGAPAAQTSGPSGPGAPAAQSPSSQAAGAKTPAPKQGDAFGDGRKA